MGSPCHNGYCTSFARTSYSLAEKYKALGALGHTTTLEALLSYPLIRTRLESLHLHLGYAHKKMRDEIKSVLRKYQEGYSKRDLHGVETFVNELFVNEPDTFIVGTGNGEWEFNC